MRPTRDGMNAEVCSLQITSVAVTAEAISPGDIDRRPAIVASQATMWAIASRPGRKGA
jgi:hypothetical protein